MEKLTNYHWKTTLANFLKRAVIVIDGEELDVPFATLRTSRDTAVAVRSASTFRQMKSTVIIGAYQPPQAALRVMEERTERLGLKRTTLQSKIRRLGIAKAQYQK